MTSLTLTEAWEAPEAVARGLAADAARWTAFGERLRERPPSAILTIARGSSDFAAAYLAYLLPLRLGCPVASLPMSLVTLYRAPLKAAGLLGVAISQSGESPDVVETLAALGRAGATTVALVNETGSPLAAVAEWCLDLAAGPERAVAATKSFIASLAAAARMAALWQNDAVLLEALGRLPEALGAAQAVDWSPAVPVFAAAEHAFVVSRGLGLSVASEAALKLKEISHLHAEAFSGAEIHHGPIALIGKGSPVLVLALRGPTLAGLVTLARELRARGAAVVLAAPDGTAERDLAMPQTASPDLDPIAAVQAFYGLAVAVAEARGFDPDAPPSLHKITRTL